MSSPRKRGSRKCPHHAEEEEFLDERRSAMVISGWYPARESLVRDLLQPKTEAHTGLREFLGIGTETPELTERLSGLLQPRTEAARALRELSGKLADFQAQFVDQKPPEKEAASALRELFEKLADFQARFVDPTKP